MPKHRMGGRRKRYQWIREQLNSTEFANAATQNVFSITDAEILGEALAAPTLVRTRGDLLLELDPATTSAAESQRVVLGLIVVAASVVSTEVGGPLSFPNLNWMWWRTVSLSAQSVITSNGVQAAPGHERVSFDVKAMRKIHKSNVLMIAEVASSSDAHVFIGGGISCLFQE